jgi:predicted O-methyltransferase YrrM
MATNYIKTKYHGFEEFAHGEDGPGVPGQVATKLMWMYRKTAEKSRPVVLELGTDDGNSSTIFLQACEEKDGRVVSVDIVDYSDISSSPRWQFVKSDSTNVDYIIKQAPHLAAGIDVMYVDSLHTRAHVEKEVMGWYPYLNQDAWIFFDDVDSNPYRKGHRKDNVNVERANDSIHEFVQEFFYANEFTLQLSIFYGTTGLACMRKRSPRGTSPVKAVRIVRRPAGIFRWLRS